MRLFFMRNGHIAAVELLESIKNDEVAIRMGSKRFLARVREGFEGFEIWERDRMVFQYPGDDDSHAGPASGQKGKMGSGGASGGRQGKALPNLIPLNPGSLSDGLVISL